MSASIQVRWSQAISGRLPAAPVCQWCQRAAAMVSSRWVIRVQTLGWCGRRGVPGWASP